MVSINPLGAFIMDLALVESHFEFNHRVWPDFLTPAISFSSRAVEVPQTDGLIAVGVESTISVSPDAQSEEGSLFSCRVVVGCTVAAPATEKDSGVLQQLTEQAVRTNVGFARTVIYQQTLSSQLPRQLIIPPMSFDGKLDE